MCIKCLMYKSPRLISWLLNTHQESFPILKPMNLLFGLWLGFPLFALRAYKSSPLLTLTGLAYSWCQHAFPELQSLCYSRINSIFGNLNLSQFNSLFRLTVVSILFFFLAVLPGMRDLTSPTRDPTRVPYSVPYSGSGVLTTDRREFP